MSYISFRKSYGKSNVLHLKCLSNQLQAARTVSGRDTATNLLQRQIVQQEAV